MDRSHRKGGKMKEITEVKDDAVLRHRYGDWLAGRGPEHNGKALSDALFYNALRRDTIGI
jgi:hypothetical protein